MPGFAHANAAIREQQRLQSERRRARRRALLPIETIDSLIGDLEQLHLAGRKRVPESMEPRLEALLGMLPPELRLDLQTRITIGRLMDRLYTIQDGLLARLGSRAAFGDLDEDLEEDARPRHPASGLPEAS